MARPFERIGAGPAELRFELLQQEGMGAQLVLHFFWQGVELGIKIRMEFGLPLHSLNIFFKRYIVKCISRSVTAQHHGEGVRALPEDSHRSRENAVKLLGLTILKGCHVILAAQPLGQGFFAPVPIVPHGVERTKSGIVEYGLIGLIGVNDGMPHPEREGPAGGSLKLSEEIRWYDRRVFHD